MSNGMNKLLKGLKPSKKEKGKLLMTFFFWIWNSLISANAYAQRKIVKTKHRSFGEVNKSLNAFAMSKSRGDVFSFKSHKRSEKYITTIFADICNFTGMNRELGNRISSKIAHEFFSTMSTIVNKHNGTIGNFLGDAILIFFGTITPYSKEDQAVMSLECANEMLLAFKDLNLKWQKSGLPEVKIRIGIHAGKAEVGFFGSGKEAQYTAIGNSVNMAKRIQGAAAPNSIYFSSNIEQFASIKYTYASANFHSLKGIEYDQELFAITEKSDDEVTYLIEDLEAV